MPAPVRSIRLNQFVLAVPSWLTRAESYVDMADTNCAVLRTLGTRVTDDAEAVVLYSTTVPWCPPADPDLVVMSTTPLAAFAP